MLNNRFYTPIITFKFSITCLQQFNGVKVVQRYNFDPVKYTFAPYLAYIRQIRETWIHSWSLVQNVHPALAAIS